MNKNTKLALVLSAAALLLGVPSANKYIKGVKSEARAAGCSELAQKALSNPLLQVSCLDRNGQIIVKVQAITGQVGYIDLETDTPIDNFKE
jgi:hypothetical protein